MRTAARSALLWTVGGLHFIFLALGAIALASVMDPRQFNGLLRICCRNVLRLAGVEYEVRYAPGFDRGRTSFFLPNHVNLFDPFVLHPAIPQFARGLELESHFSIPVYGWLMKRLGNVPVPALKSHADLKRMWRLAKAAIASGTSLVIFPEGRRTTTGRVGPFKDGAFRMAVEFGVPVTPVSIAGSFEFNNKLSWLLRPSKIVVHVHETIDTSGLRREDIPGLVKKVHAIVSRCV